MQPEMHFAYLIAELLFCVMCDVTSTALAHWPALWESSLEQ